MGVGGWDERCGRMGCEGMEMWGMGGWGIWGWEDGMEGGRLPMHWIR